MSTGRSLLIRFYSNIVHHNAHKRADANRLWSPSRLFGSKPRRLLDKDLRSMRKVRLISESGKEIGLMSGSEAISTARQASRDVVQVFVRPPAPPVLRLLDFQAVELAGRKKDYEQRKKAKEVKRQQRRETSLKQVRLSPATDVNDFQIKLRKAKQFLMDGYRVKVFMLFRRGQGGMADAAKQSLVQAAKLLSEFGSVQGVPKEGTFADLFKKPQPNSEDVDPEGAEEENRKKAPLEVLVFPLSRKARESFREKQGEGDGLDSVQV